jgi:hypothetical protein
MRYQRKIKEKMRYNQQKKDFIYLKTQDIDKGIIFAINVREYPINKIPSFAVQLPESFKPTMDIVSGSSSKSEWVCLNLDAPLVSSLLKLH